MPWLGYSSTIFAGVCLSFFAPGLVSIGCDPVGWLKQCDLAPIISWFFLLNVLINSLFILMECPGFAWIGCTFDSGTAKAYLCDQGSTMYLFFRLPCCIFNLAKKNGITPILAYIPSHLKCGSQLSVMGKVASRMALLLYIAQVAFHCWGQPEVEL